jgi:phospholipid-binding lipoprotein MlaA
VGGYNPSQSRCRVLQFEAGDDFRGTCSVTTKYIANKHRGYWTTSIFACFLAVLSLLGGCSTVAPPQLPLGSLLAPTDPFEAYNRKITEFNDGADRIALKPVASAYQNSVPYVIRTGVSNFFNNYWDIWYAGNALLQGEPAKAADNILRFNINMTLGFFGVLDLAGEFGVERSKKDLGQTLARWGVKSGPYLVLPLFGPTTLRDALVRPAELKGEQIRNFKDVATRNNLYVLRAVEARANLLRVGEVLDGAALDKYTFTRDAYLQLRNNEIWDGNPPEEPDASSPMPGTAPAAPPAPPPAAVPTTEPAPAQK